MSIDDRNELGPVDWSLRLRWLAWSFVPSAMLLAVTLHISIDIAATPFLWVLPLALYLLTFVFSFSRRSLIPEWLSNRLHAWVTIGVVLYFAAPDPMLVLGLHIGMLFFTGLVCHQALAKQRPHVARLTEFYLWISLGGCLGGVFGALISPMVFDSLLEYPILIVAAALLRPTLSSSNGRSRLLDLLLPLAVGLYALTPRLLPSLNPLQLGGWGALIFYLLLIYALDRFKDRPVRFGLSTAVLLAIVLLYQPEADVLGRWRTFYGIYEVTDTPNGKVRQLHHGTTLHGAQAIDPRYHRLPLTYFTLDAPLGQVVSALRGEGKLKDIAVMGLGVGTLACHFQSDERLTFFEIDPRVAEIAGDKRLFSYLSTCNQAEVQIRINDGRIGLEKLPDRSLDLIVMDAFSSDAIPTHLITREAIQGYTDKLREGGAVLIHVSNRYVDMVPILGEIASSLDLVALHQHYVPTEAERRRFAASSNWLLILPPWQGDHVLAKDERWKQVAGNGESAVWTDERSSLLPSLRWNRLLWTRGAPD